MFRDKGCHTSNVGKGSKPTDEFDLYKDLPRERCKTKCLSLGHGCFGYKYYLVENVRFRKSQLMESRWNPYMVWTAAPRTIAQEETYMLTLEPTSTGNHHGFKLFDGGTMHFHHHRLWSIGLKDFKTIKSTTSKMKRMHCLIPRISTLSNMKKFQVHPCLAAKVMRKTRQPWGNRAWAACSNPIVHSGRTQVTQYVVWTLALQGKSTTVMFGYHLSWVFPLNITDSSVVLRTCTWLILLPTHAYAT